MIGKAIAHYLKVRKMTQASLSEQTGISPSSITQYIKGKRNPTEEGLQTIANVLGIPVKDMKELAYSFEKEEGNSVNDMQEPYIVDEHRLKRRMELIYGHNDVVIELTKYILLTTRTRVHDVIYEINNVNRRVGIPRDRRPSLIEAISEKVIREFLNESLEEIAYRIQEEMKYTEITINDIVENLRKEQEY